MTDARQAYANKARAEIDALVGRGVVMAGNAFSQVLLVKGEPENDELTGALLAGADGAALRAALGVLGYEPQDWAGLASVRADGEPLDPQTLRLAVVTLDPSTLIALDEPAAAALRESFADELVALEDLDAAMLRPGVVATLLGMRVMALGGFAKSLADPAAKQRMWARLKLLPPLGEPY